MSLAQRVERPLILNSDSPLLGASPVRTAVPLDFRDITRRVAPGSPVALARPESFAEPAARAEHVSEPRRESELAFQLLDEVSRAVPSLVERCDKLNLALSEAREQARLDVEAAHEVAGEWQQIASALKLQVEGLEKGFKSMKQRAEAAERQIVDLRDTAGKSQHAAAEAECLSSLFQDKVISTFGVGSMLHPLLETFRAKPVTTA